MWTEIVDVAKPYRFTDALKRMKLNPLYEVRDDWQVVRLALLVAGQAVAVEIAVVEEQSSCWRLVVRSKQLSPEKVVPIIARQFGWHVNQEEVIAQLAKTPLASLVERFGGTPLILDDSPFACLMKCMIHQQLNLKFAHTLTKRFMTSFGTEIDGLVVCPTPERVAQLTVEQLRELQLSTRKAEYIIGIAQAVSVGTLQLGQVEQWSDEQIRDHLLPIKGIGRWTVDNFLMFGLGRRNLFPTADVGLQNGLKRLLQLEEKPSIAMMEQWKATFEPFASYAALYLWRSMEEI